MSFGGFAVAAVGIAGLYWCCCHGARDPGHRVRDGSNRLCDVLSNICGIFCLLAILLVFYGHFVILRLPEEDVMAYRNGSFFNGTSYSSLLHFR